MEPIENVANLAYRRNQGSELPWMENPSYGKFGMHTQPARRADYIQPSCQVNWQIPRTLALRQQSKYYRTQHTSDLARGIHGGAEHSGA